MDAPLSERLGANRRPPEATTLATSVVMPALGESVAEAALTRWLKRVGENVMLGESLVEVSTDIVDTEIIATASVVIEFLLVQEHQAVDIGTPIATIAGALGYVAV